MRHTFSVGALTPVTFRIVFRHRPSRIGYQVSRVAGRPAAETWLRSSSCLGSTVRLRRTAERDGRFVRTRPSYRRMQGRAAASDAPSASDPHDGNAVPAAS
jgi:hypothetical protein